jgi:hypothetical protein
MVKHQETHPNLDVEGCFGCRIAHVRISSAATPTRRQQVQHIANKEAVLDKDLDAYKRLRNDGLQPRKIDGAAEVEKRAETKAQVESGLIP